MRQPTSISCGALWCLVIAAIASSAASSAEHPNVLLIVTDDQRPDTIAALGNPQISTPTLDRLVHAGTTFTRATCAYPLCYPSRAELLTGSVSVVHRGQFGADQPLWPRVMRDAGYETWYVGKWHTRGRPADVGYENVDGLYGAGQKPEIPQRDRQGELVTGYVGWQFQTADRQLMPEKGIGLTPNISAEFADAAVRILNREHTRPFFLHVNFTAPHDPLFYPTGYEQRYRPEQMLVPLNFSPEHPFDHGNLKGRDELLWPFPRTRAMVRDELTAYYALITHLDAQVGRILDVLDQRGLADNTLVIFTSDHGLAIGSHGLRGKQNMYEHTINVPLIFRGPGIPADWRVAASCYLRDLFPTVCEWAGIAAPQTEGVSLAPILRGERTDVYPFIVGYFGDSQRMIRQGRWKLIRYPLVGKTQLFRLDDDPDEMRNLSGQAEHQEQEQK
ncbi:MAG: choline-sulfatase, partial [Planctomycetales bacterium 12-60-4]